MRGGGQHTQKPKQQTIKHKLQQLKQTKTQKKIQQTEN